MLLSLDLKGDHFASHKGK